MSVAFFCGSASFVDFSTSVVVVAVGWGVKGFGFNGGWHSALGLAMGRQWGYSEPQKVGTWV